MWNNYVIYNAESCASDPVYMSLTPTDNCLFVSSCNATSNNTTERYEADSCWTGEWDAAILNTFSDMDFFGLHAYADTDCTDYQGTSVFLADGTCNPSWSFSYGITATLKNHDDAVIDTYSDLDCEDGHDSFPISASQIANASCVELDPGFYYVVFTSASMEGSVDASASSAASASASAFASSSSSGDTTMSGSADETSSGLTTGTIVGIVIGCVIAVLLIGGLFLWHRRHQRELRSSTRQEALLDGNGHKTNTSEGTTAPSTDPSRPRDTTGQAGLSLWDDETIISWRVPREKVISTTLISRGGYGEVYKGTYNGQDIAIKMLLPETRRSRKHVNALLAEVKMMAALEHSCVVQFIGVAWDSFNDLCVLAEYMVGGDLRELLQHYEVSNYPQGFNYDKVKIALHIAHALTYLHSLHQPVIHRDLKSKNVLLTPELDAKLTDFGVSRERVDRTMTAGVGTSLWMAPEVMMGEKYGTAADMFSFGVLLSELDLHSLPYSHANESLGDGRKLPNAAILQMVAMGKLRVDFSTRSLPEVVALGNACVSTNPTERPTAAMALYRLQEVLKHL